MNYLITTVLCGLMLAGIASPTFAAIYGDLNGMGSSAGMVSIGNIGGFGRDASVVLDNPAALEGAGTSASLFYTSLFGGDVVYLSTAVSIQPIKRVSLGIGVQMESIPNNDETALDTNDQIVSTGQFDYGSYRFVAGGAYRVTPELSVGMAFVYYLKRLGTVEGRGGDLMAGINVKTDVGTVLVAANNIHGSRIAFNTGGEERLDHEYVLGFQSSPMPFMSCTIYGQLKSVGSLRTPLKAAGIRTYPLDSRIFAISAGYKEIGSAIEAHKGGATMGLSLVLDEATIEYAYDTVDIYQQESQHFLSLAIQF
jgi:hypothetical protein